MAAAGIGISLPGSGVLRPEALGLALLAFGCEYVDSTLGMGYGTALTPLLMLGFGIEPLVIVPCVLLSELLTGLSAGAAHHLAGNVSFTRRSRATRVAAVLSACSVVGTVAAVLVALHVPGFWLKLLIGLIVLSMGLFILWARSREFAFSWRRVTALGLLAAFNKGLSGGGYGPLVTGGQIISGVEEKSAIGITSVSEGVTCAVGVLVFLLAGRGLEWSLAVPLTCGALASVPVSAVTVNRVGRRTLRRLVGAATLALGALTLVRLF
ncbi:MAG: hypothetical protein AMK73_09180 [Planctomycetes bacterium SM23_32]|nr:MAG: hypothetical protein AMK73_09180 [Planctomycetes bacterium SM23_32]